MSWQQTSDGGLDGAQASAIGSQAGAFLITTVRAEVDGARMDPIDVLISANHSSVYAVAAMQGPLRAYLATAWGTAGHASGKKIVSYPSLAEARTAAAELIQQHLAGQGSALPYMRLGRYTTDSPEGAGA